MVKQAYKQTSASAAALAILPTIKHCINLFSYIFSEKAYYTVRFLTVVDYPFSDKSLDSCPLLLVFLSRPTLSLDRAWHYVLRVDQLNSIRLSRGLSREVGRCCSHVSSSVLDGVSPFARANALFGLQ